MAAAVAVAPSVNAPLEKHVTRPTKQLPRALIENARKPERVKFDPKKHLRFVEPKSRIAMKDIGLEGAGISPVAVTDPFSLFTEEAIEQMRAEIFSEAVLENCQVTSSFATNMIRNYAGKYGSFICDAWHSPEVAAIVSKVAGVDLVPAMDVDIGHVNVSVSTREAPACQPGENVEGEKDEKPAFAWHNDSYPFVCVTMLSDCTGMVGGETALRTGTGDILKVRGPSRGTAVVMQGRYIEHQALKALGGRERISMVTSFRPKSVFMKDETVLTSLRGITDWDEMYYQYAEYRLLSLATRFNETRKQLLERQKTQPKFDVDQAREFLEEQKRYIDAMLTELIKDE